MTTTPDEGALQDNDLETVGGTATPETGDADGTDGDSYDSSDGDSGDSDGTDGGDSDGTDGGDSDGTDG